MSRLTLVEDYFVDTKSPEIVNLTYLSSTDATNYFEIYHLSITYLSCHFLVISLISCFPLLNKSQFKTWRILIEIAVLFLPLLISVTLLSNFSIIIPYVILFTALQILFTKSRVQGAMNWPEFIFVSKPVPIKSPAITNLYSNVIATVVIGILAVDFQFFPQKLAKTKVYGFSAMDLGVSAFVSLNALLSNEARQLKPASSNLRKSLLGSSVLILLGFARCFLITITGYHQEVTEYGLHWNFFFTLSLTKVISSWIIPRISSPLKFGVCLAIGYQIVLLMGLNSVIFSPHRNGFILANKEGIFSLFGYVSMYMVFISIGKRFFEKRDRKSNMDLILFIGDLIFLASVTGALGFLSHNYLEPSSRRECNLTFICLSVSCLSFVFATELGFEVFTDILYYFMVLKKSPFMKSLVNEALARRGLLVFLFANILTGVINMTLRPRTMGIFASFLINFVYLFAVGVFAVFAHKGGIGYKSMIFPFTSRMYSY